MRDTVLIVYAVVSLVTFVTYGLDKRAARLNRRRVPEARLHLFELLGGWPGALMAQQIFAHKRRKLRFMLVTFLITAAHLAVWVWAWDRA